MKYSTAIIFNFLSWLALVLGILYFILFPLALFDALEISWNMKSENIVRANKMNAHLEKGMTIVSQSSNPQEILNIAAQVYPEGIKGVNTNDIPNLKKLVINQLKGIQIKFNQDNIETYKNKLIKLYKNALSTVIGLILSGTCFVMIWRLTRWARVIFRK